MHAVDKGRGRAYHSKCSIRTEYWVMPLSLESPPCLYTQLYTGCVWREVEVSGGRWREEAVAGRWLPDMLLEV